MTLPNQLSALRLALAPVFLYFFIQEDSFARKAAFVIFFVAMFTDWYDGLLARKYGQVSKTGIFLDPLADKFLTSAAFAAFYLLGLMPLWMVTVIVVRDILITLLRSYEEYRGKTLKTSYAAKTKTFIQMAYIFIIVIMLSIRAVFPDAGINELTKRFFDSGVNYIFALAVTLLTLYTGITYFVDLYKSSAKAVENN